jgi:hypothetical protein
MNNQVYLYTENLFLYSKIKNIIKILLGKNRGPQAVYYSLTTGLKDLRQEFSVNEKLSAQLDVACVVSGVKTLKYAILQKNKGLIRKIIAGPNIIVSPEDSGGILKSALIDKVVVPSNWVKDYYISKAPELLNKIYVWPSGVDVPNEEKVKKEYDFLIYNKITKDTSFYDQIYKYLIEQGFKVRTLVYGSFKQEEYFEALKKAKYLIYLSKSESQGLAMFEAWARNVPTFVWERGFMEYKNDRFEGNTATPYLTEESGMSFKDFTEFQQKLNSFISYSFTPRKYIEDNFNLKSSAQKYLDIIHA